ncbi:MAG: 2-phosphosulfolactate phosphatase [Nanoarchaeota archaeon]|nr:2-phosphosulfolactate phosphatase [Nanoarchaeota archaeon]
MKIRRKSLYTGARDAKGLSVIIDVFRAYSVAGYVFGNGAEKILLTQTIEDALAIKKKNPDFILMGEKKGLRPEGFDYGNSPYDVSKLDFRDKRIAMVTQAGTQGIHLAKSADEVLAGSFLCIGAIVRYIQKRNPKIVTLVGMGAAGRRKRDEDELCADYIQLSLEGGKPDFKKMKTYLRTYMSAKKFFNKNLPEFPEQDFECSLDLDRFDFVMKAYRQNGKIWLKKEDVS